jgi:hypothetical protein
MKKTAIIFTVILMSMNNNAFYGSQLIQKEHDQECVRLRFLDNADDVKDEYGYPENEQADVDEYDQHVCDGVQLPKICAAEAFIKEMFGFVLIQYITIREMAHAYCKEVKDALNKWFTTFIKP